MTLFGFDILPADCSQYSIDVTVNKAGPDALREAWTRKRRVLDFSSSNEEWFPVDCELMAAVRERFEAYWHIGCRRSVEVEER